MTYSVEDTVYKIENKIEERINIPNKWKRHILKKFKKDISRIRRLEELRTVLRAWAWIYKGSDVYWEVINLIDFMKATTIFFMANTSLLDQGIDPGDINPSKEKTMQQRYRRAMYRLAECELIYSVQLLPEEVGKGKRTTTIWKSPFAKDVDVDKCRKLYIAIGGEIGRPRKRKKMTPKDLDDFNRLQKYHKMANEALKDASNYKFVKCPKKCKNSVHKHSKVDFKVFLNFKGELAKLKCPKCKKKMIIISPLEYAKLLWESIFDTSLEELEKTVYEKTYES